jgi:plasmid maintenance system killer protein
MKRFSDKKTRQIHDTRFADGIPEHVAIGAHKVMRLLVAACGLQDVGVIGCILRWPNAPNRYGLHVDGKWHVTFSWSSQEIGAYEILLERR